VSLENIPAFVIVLLLLPENTLCLVDHCGYRFSLISAGLCTSIRVGMGGCHCWHSALCSCFCNVHTDLEQSSLPLILAFKNVTNTLRLFVRGA